jgi:hypothetical protein
MPKGARYKTEISSDGTPYVIDTATGLVEPNLTAQARNSGMIGGPKVPAGYMRDPNNPQAVMPIPGSEDDEKRRKDAEAKAKTREAELVKGKAVLSAIGDIEGILKNTENSWSPVDPAVGAVSGTVLQSGWMPVLGQSAKNVAASLDTIKGNISLQSLQAMREASPSGASGLGSVTEQEGQRLAASLAALDQSQSRDQFQKNLQRVKSEYERIVHGRELTPEERKTGRVFTPREFEEYRAKAARQGQGSPQGAQPVNGVSWRLKQRSAGGW